MTWQQYSKSDRINIQTKCRDKIIDSDLTK